MKKLHNFQLSIKEVNSDLESRKYRNSSRLHEYLLKYILLACTGLQVYELYLSSLFS